MVTAIIILNIFGSRNKDDSNNGEMIMAIKRPDNRIIMIMITM